MRSGAGRGSIRRHYGQSSIRGRSAALVTASVTAQVEPKRIREELLRLQRQLVNAAERGERIAWAFCELGAEWRAGVIVQQASTLKHFAGVLDAILANLDNQLSEVALNGIRRNQDQQKAHGQQMRIL